MFDDSPSVDVGSKFDPQRHKVVKLVSGAENGIIVEQIRPGIIFNNDEVIR